MASFDWTAPDGGSWTKAADWSPRGIPGAGDDVTFQIGAFYTVAGADTVKSITVDGDGVTFAGTVDAENGLNATDYASVTIDQGAAVTTSSLSLDSGTQLSVAGVFTDTGTPGALGGTADLVTIAGQAADLVAGAAIALNLLQISDSGTYAGDVTLNDGGSVTLDTSATFGGGTLTLAGNGTLYVSNAGTDTSGSLALQKAIVLAAATDGLQIADDPGVTLALSGGISGAGYVDVNSGMVFFNSPNTYTGGTIVDGATLTLLGAGAAGTGAVFLNNALLVTDAGGETVVGSGGADTIDAASGNLLVFGGNAATLSFTGGAAASTVVGGAGVLTANSGAGGGALFAGTSGQDVLTAGAGATTLATSSGGTLITTGNAADNLVAAGGNTTLVGGSASGGNVFFVSGTGSTVVETGAGTDTVIAAGAAQQIFAGVGTQDVFLNAGTSQLNFIDGFAGGTMSVIGFADGDTLHFANYEPGAEQAALATAVVTGGSTILTLSDSTHIVLFGVTDLTSSSFV